MLVSDYAKGVQAVDAGLFEEPSCLDALFARQPTEHLSPGQPLFYDGDEARHVFQVVSGTLRLFRIISDGRRVITDFLHAGDIVGVAMRGHYCYTAEAIAATRLRRMPRRQFELAIHNIDHLRQDVFTMLCDDMAAAREQMVLLSSKSAEERLCTFLLRYLRRALAEGGAEPVVELPMSRQDMADYLGLTIETVSRTITRLIGKGVLKVVDPAARHCIRIERPGMLAQLAGDSDECAELRRELVAQGGGRRH